jgi:hypothetical protein
MNEKVDEGSKNNGHIKVIDNEQLLFQTAPFHFIILYTYYASLSYLLYISLLLPHIYSVISIYQCALYRVLLLTNCWLAHFSSATHTCSLFDMFSLAFCYFSFTYFTHTPFFYLLHHLDISVFYYHCFVHLSVYLALHLVWLVFI